MTTQTTTSKALVDRPSDFICLPSFLQNWRHPLLLVFGRRAKKLEVKKKGMRGKENPEGKDGPGRATINLREGIAMRKVFGFVLLIVVCLWPIGPSLAANFAVGELSFKDYDGYYYFLDLENLTNLYLGVPADFSQIVFSFSLDDGFGSYENNYVITLSDTNEDDVYDDLTYLWFADYDSLTNTYSDGEDVSSLPSGESLLNLVADPYNSALLIDPYLYIKDLNVSFAFTLNNYTYTENGVDYVFSGTVNYNATFLDDAWYNVGDLGLTGWGQILNVDIQGTPVNGGVQPIPEPKTVFLFGFALLCLSFLKPRLRRS